MFSQAILFVSGAPASGKSTVAHALAKALPAFVLLQKDAIKEALFDARPIDQRTTPGISRMLSDAAMQELWKCAQQLPRVILDANFRTGDTRERQRFLSLAGKKLEVHCRCAPEEAIRRFSSRARTRHPAHTLHTLSAELLAEFDRPFGLSPVIEVDTNAPLDTDRLLAQLRRHWPQTE